MELFQILYIGDLKMEVKPWLGGPQCDAGCQCSQHHRREEVGDPKEPEQQENGLLVV